MPVGLLFNFGPKPQFRRKVYETARLKPTAAADLAVEYSAQSGNDEVLAGFLTSNAARRNKTIARDLAAKISDETRRTEILNFLK